MKRELTLLLEFWRGSFRHYLFITTVAFFILLILGYFLGLFLSDFAASVMDWFGQLLEQAGVVDEEGSISVFPLFFNNFRAMLLGIAYGLIPFLFYPALNLGFNAMIIGIFGAVYTASDVGLLPYLAGILPHGIFEIPALIFSISCGIYLCRTVTEYVKHNEKGSVKTALFNCLRLFVFVIIPLLIIAAVIECYVTPLVMELFL